MAAGDVMLARTVGSRMKQDPSAPFAGVTDIFDKADLVLLNLECTISTRGTREPKSFAFRARPLAAKVLKDAHVDIVSQANNHGMDYGPVAMADARELLAAQGIDVIGAGENSSQARAPVIVDQNGLRVAFLAYLGLFHDSGGWSAYPWEAGPSKPGLALARKKQIRADVRNAQEDADVVVVFYHAGDALDTTPSDLQRSLTNAALDAGAQLVISTSPHILQGTRREGKTFVAYSLGNFVFDESRNSANDSVILDVTLSKAGVDSVRLIPILMVDAFPRRATGADAARIRRRLGPV
jgi:poly-gamma-glutamate synthesis protein (capsule biosynthesis protein)